MNKPLDYDGGYVEKEVLDSAVAAIDPDRAGMDRDSMLSLAGAMKNCGYSAGEFGAVAARSASDKGTFTKQFASGKISGKGGKGGDPGAGTIIYWAKQSGWTLPEWKKRPQGQQSSAKKPQDNGLAVWKDDFKLSCIIDSVGYAEKPTAVYEIRKREQTPTPAPEPISPEEFAKRIARGCTFSPTVYNKVLTGYDKDNKPIYVYQPIEQQVFVVDIDNEEFVKDENGGFVKGPDGKRIKKRIDNPLTIDAAKAVCKREGIVPFMIYETFSSKKHRDNETEPYQKFRLCFATDKPLKAQEVGEQGINATIEYFIGLFGKAADKGTVDYARLIYGTNEPDRVAVYRKFLDGQKLLQKIYEKKYSPADPDQEEPEAEPLTLEEYQQTNAAAQIDSFLNDIERTKDRQLYKTGFENLDKAMDGGFYPGLYFIGAVSSLGKTTFCQQITDNMAQAGHDVMIFSLEMTRNEMIAKSISRLTYLNAGKRPYNAKTTRGILDGARQDNYSSSEKTLIKHAVEKYKEYAKHVYIHAAVGQISIDDIIRKVEKHIELTGNIPFVLIDYLQILQPCEDKKHPNRSLTDKQMVDKAVTELKLLSDKTGTPVLAISSFNRDNYSQSVSMGAFKESGGIEYGSDMLMALQPQGMVQGAAKRDVQHNVLTMSACKAADVKKVELVILKSRNSRPFVRIGFEYRAAFNYFSEDGQMGVYCEHTAPAKSKAEATETDEEDETDKDEEWIPDPGQLVDLFTGVPVK